MAVRRRAAVLGFASAVSIGLAAPLRAQSDFPDKPIRFVVPFGAGGTMDVVARTVGNEAGKTLGQPIVVENRPGAGGSSGPAAVAQAKPDGYTLMVAAPTQVPVALALKTRTSYDAARDFIPVTKLAEEALVVMTSRTIPATTLPEFVAYLKANPGKVNYSSAGVGSLGHLAGELFKARAGVDIQHIPYKGGPAGTFALISGDVGLSLTSAGSGSAYFDKINVLASLGTRRISILPDVATAIELGVAGLVVTSWAGVFAPTGTPPGVVAKLDDTFRKALTVPSVIETLQRLGIETVGLPPAEFARSLEQDLKLWTDVVDQARIVIE
jgi:tripartite-type tricarboxylate transporter receptor subunit TctC